MRQLTYLLFWTVGLSTIGCGGSTENIPLPPAPQAETTATAPEAEAPVMVREEAKVGAGVKGRGYGGGVVTTPIAAYFSAQERITYEIQVPRAIKDYNALHGRNPNEEEFWTWIKEYGVSFPQLPEGHRYVYEQSSGQLFVEKPAP